MKKSEETFLEETDASSLPYLVTPSWIARKLNISPRTFKVWVEKNVVHLHTIKVLGRYYYEKNEALEAIKNIKDKWYSARDVPHRVPIKK